MLTDLLKTFTSVYLGGEELRLRYSLNSELCLEMTYKPLRDILSTPFPQWTDEDILQLLRAGFCDLPENKDAVNRRQWDGVQPDLQTLGTLLRPEDRTAAVLSILESVAASFPEKKDDAPAEAPADQDEGDLYAYCRYQMGMSEEEFFSYTEKELAYRIERYSRTTSGYTGGTDAEKAEEKIIVKEIDDS